MTNIKSKIGGIFQQLPMNKELPKFVKEVEYLEGKLEEGEILSIRKEWRDGISGRFDICEYTPWIVVYTKKENEEEDLTLSLDVNGIIRYYDLRFIQVALPGIEWYANELTNNLKKDGIDCSNLELDCLGYGSDTKEQCVNYQKNLSSMGELLTETKLKEKSILTYRLTDPVEVDNRKMHLVELISPKEADFTLDGFKYIKFLIKDSFQKFMNEHPKVKFDTKDISNSINPNISINYDKFSAKFYNPLEHINH